MSDRENDTRLRHRASLPTFHTTSYNDRRRDDSPEERPVRSRRPRQEERGYDRDRRPRSPRRRDREGTHIPQDRRRYDRSTSRGYKSSRRRSRSPRDRSRDRSRGPHRDRRSLETKLDPDQHRQHRRHDSKDYRGGDSKRRRSRRSPSHSKSPPQRSSSPRDPVPYKRSSAPLPPQEAAYKGGDAVGPLVEKQKPNFERSGKLATETNTVAGTSIVLKYNEPPEARKPPVASDWRLYVFKASETLETVQLGERSCWLFGRERAVADFPVEHPSCSKQHAVLQFRFVEKRNGFGEKSGSVRPYVIDLESANGTKLNGERIPEKRFVEIVSGDVLVFGESSREYVIMLAPTG